MKKKSDSVINSELIPIRQKIDDIKRAIDSCERAINLLNEENTYSLKDYLHQLYLFLAILRLQIKKGYNYTKMSNEIGLYESRLSQFASKSNFDFSINDRLKIIQYISKNI